MQNLSFCALVQFPTAAYHEFNNSMNGIAVIDSISREGGSYNANIEFNVVDITSAITAIANLSGKVVEIIPNKIETIKATKVVQKLRRARDAETGAAFKSKTTKKDELLQLLSHWKTAKELATATGWKSSTIHARLTGIRKTKKLRSRSAPDGYLQYRIVGKAA